MDPRLYFLMLCLIGSPITESSDSDSTGRECCQYGGFVKTVDECDPSMVYDRSSQLCCMGNVVLKTSSNDECCAAEAYNPQGSDKCCSYFGDNNWRSNVSAVPSSVKKKDAQCCGALAYNPDEQTCCEINYKYGLNDNPGRKLNWCCGLTLYDRNKQVCCVGLEGEYGPEFTYNLFPLNGNKKSCCPTKTSTQVFDPDTESCCGGKVVDKKLECCSGQTFDPQKEFCCFSSSTQSLTVWTKNSPDEDCCGPDGRYNTKVDLCCGGQITPNGVGKLKCCGGRSSYDPELYKCCISREMKVPIVVNKMEPPTDDINAICNHNLDYLIRS